MTLIKPNWPSPPQIQAFCSSRQGGVSSGEFDGLNLAMHVGDDKDTVEQNRSLWQQACLHPKNAHWLNQTHSCDVLEYNSETIGSDADGVFSRKPEQVCVVMTADCLPVLFCSQSGDFVAAVHAGWRGLADGILLNAIKNYQKSSQLMAWIGPSISQKHFEVGTEVKDQFVASNPSFEVFFKAKDSNKFLADLASIAEYQLSSFGVDVYKSNLCSFELDEQFYSYRRDGQTGRMAAMIWIGGNS